MKFSVDGRIFEKFPGLNIGVLIVKGINNQGTDNELLEMMQELFMLTILII